MRDRRAQQRDLCSDIVELYWNDEAGWPRRAKAILEDISQEGACVQIEASIAIDREVAFRLGEAGFPGSVRYCTLIGGNYFVGVKFADGYGWTPEVAKPEYLLQSALING